MTAFCPIGRADFREGVTSTFREHAPRGKNFIKCTRFRNVWSKVYILSASAYAFDSGQMLMIGETREPPRLAALLPRFGRGRPLSFGSAGAFGLSLLQKWLGRLAYRSYSSISSVVDHVICARSIASALARPATAATRVHAWRFQLDGGRGLRRLKGCGLFGRRRCMALAPVQGKEAGARPHPRQNAGGCALVVRVCAS